MKTASWEISRDRIWRVCDGHSWVDSAVLYMAFPPILNFLRVLLMMAEIQKKDVEMCKIFQYIVSELTQLEILFSPDQNKSQT